MPWLQLELILDAARTEQIEASLLAAGVLALSFDDAAEHPLYAPDAAHPPLWPHTRLTALFTEDTDPEALRVVLTATLGTLPWHRITRLEDREWTREWLKDFKPMRFGRRLWIVPSVYTPPDPYAINIRLDPGLAFGTGTHPTTALCLEWLDQAEVHGKSVIDYGCGSGILAVAAARLGANPVWAVDNDPQALAATEENAMRNQMSNIIRVGYPERCSTDPADTLLANILAAPLCELAPQFASLVKPGGHVILSGILENQRLEIEKAYRRDFHIFNVVRRQEWLRMDGVRRPART